MSRYVWRILYVGDDGLRIDRGLAVAANRQAALLQMRDRLLALCIPFVKDSVCVDGDRLTITFDGDDGGVDHVWQVVKGITAPLPGERWNHRATA